jgi:hypothetical protein
MPTNPYAIEPSMNVRDQMDQRAAAGMAWQRNLTPTGSPSRAMSKASPVKPPVTQVDSLVGLGTPLHFTKLG